MCSRRPPRHHLSTIGVFFIGNEAATWRGLGGPGGLANGREWGCQHFATQYQLEHQVTAVAAVSACVLMAEEAVRWVSPKPTLASRFFGHAHGQEAHSEAVQPPGPLGLCQFFEVHWHL